MNNVEQLRRSTTLPTVRVEVTPDQSVHWLYQHSDVGGRRPCFRTRLMEDMWGYLTRSLRESQRDGKLRHPSSPGRLAFNLGGDLELFSELIRGNNAAQLDRPDVGVSASITLAGDVHHRPHRAMRWAAASKWRWPATPSSPRKASAWACPKSADQDCSGWAPSRSCASAFRRSSPKIILDSTIYSSETCTRWASSTCWCQGGRSRGAGNHRQAAEPPACTSR